MPQEHLKVNNWMSCKLPLPDSCLVWHHCPVVHLLAPNSPNCLIFVRHYFFTMFTLDHCKCFNETTVASSHVTLPTVTFYVWHRAEAEGTDCLWYLMMPSAQQCDKSRRQLLLLPGVNNENVPWDLSRKSATFLLASLLSITVAFIRSYVARHQHFL